MVETVIDQLKMGEYLKMRIHGYVDVMIDSYRSEMRERGRWIF
jgi:hypothetical protein